MDAFEKPPANLTDLYKTYRSHADVFKDPHVLDLRDPSADNLKNMGSISSQSIISACLELEDTSLRTSEYDELLRVVTADKPILEHTDMPGTSLG
jgi:hypothetical protein